MSELRRPLFLLAAVLLLVAIGLELGVSLLPFDGAVAGGAAASLGGLTEGLAPEDAAAVRKALAESDPDRPTGIGISYLALLDGLLLFTVLLMALPLLVPARVHGKLQGVLTLIISIVVLIVGIVLALLAIVLLLLMVGLFLAAPFGTIAYLALFGAFARGGAAATLSVLLLLKLGFVGCLIAAQPRFLQNKGLMALIATSLLAGLLLSFLHNFVPIILVSITDALGAIIVAVLALIWALWFLIRSLPAVIKALRVDRVVS